MIITVSSLLAWCGTSKNIDADTKDPIPAAVQALENSTWTPSDATYTPPTKDEFYTEIEKRRIEKNNANDLDVNQREIILKRVLSSHESHLVWLTNEQMRERAYGIVLQQVLDTAGQ